MSEVSIIIDFEISPQLIRLYSRSSTDEFIGNDQGFSYKEAETTLKLIKRTHRRPNSNLDLLGIMKIYKSGVLVGFAFPRVIIEKEKAYFKIKNNHIPYVRLGTVYIDKPYRGKGIMKEALRIFMIDYPDIVWECLHDNIASEKTALSAGLEYAHTAYVRKVPGEEPMWKTEPFDSQTNIMKVFRTPER